MKIHSWPGMAWHARCRGEYINDPARRRPRGLRTNSLELLQVQVGGGCPFGRGLGLVVERYELPDLLRENVSGDERLHYQRRNLGCLGGQPPRLEHPRQGAALHTTVHADQLQRPLGRLAAGKLKAIAVTVVQSLDLHGQDPGSRMRP